MAGPAPVGQRVRVHRNRSHSLQLQGKLSGRVDAPGRQRLHHRKLSRRSGIEHSLRKKGNRLRERRRDRVAVLQVARINAPPELQGNLGMRRDRNAGAMTRSNRARLFRRISDRRPRRRLYRAGLCGGVRRRLVLRLLRRRRKTHAQYRCDRQRPRNGKPECHRSHHAQLP